jgi:hypothetical protein
LSRDHWIRFAIAAAGILASSVVAKVDVRRWMPDEHGVSRAESDLPLDVVDRLRALGRAGVGT